MKTVLRLISKKGNEYFDVPNNYSMIPRKGDNFVFLKQCYTVSYLEFDFDNDTVYIISIL